LSSPVVIDTNVAMVANGSADQAGPDCVLACIDALLRVRDDHRLLMDDGGRILDEYRCNLSPSGQPGAGDAFFNWLWDNQWNAERCERVPITPNGHRGFVEFPDDPDLAAFDPADRKFVAVALASALDPPIMNASDNDWCEYRDALEHHGVEVQFLCPDLMSEDCDGD